MGGYVVEIPEEPADRTVVLDRDANAWQRRGSRWYGVKQGMFMSAPEALSTSWKYLLIDCGPLTPLITDDDCGAEDRETSWSEFCAEAMAAPSPEGWARAGFADPDLERYVQPEGVERVDAPGLDDETAPTTELTDAQRDSLLATYGQALDYREIDQRVIGLKHAAGACASTWQLTDDPDGGVTSRVTRAYPAGDEG